MWADVGRDHSYTSPRFRGKKAAAVPKWAQPPKHKIGFFRTTNQAMFNAKLPQSARVSPPPRYVAPKGFATSRLATTKDKNFDFYMTTNKSFMKGKVKKKKKVHFSSPVSGQANTTVWGGFRHNVSRTSLALPPPPKVRPVGPPYYSSQKYYYAVKHWKSPRLAEEPKNFETSHKKFHAKVNHYDNQKLVPKSRTYSTTSRGGYAVQCSVGGPISAWGGLQ
uniref:Uncharacterized protein n=1 Tax=Lotharella globosa TaxID=91324 RepID=A0A7S3Z955_9EUKA